MSAVGTSSDGVSRVIPEQDALHRKIVEMLSSVSNECLAEQGFHQKQQQIQQLQAHVAHYQRKCRELAAESTALQQQNAKLLEDKQIFFKINQDQVFQIRHHIYNHQVLEVMAKGRPEEAYQKLYTEYGKLELAYRLASSDAQALLSIVNDGVQRGKLSINHLSPRVVQMLNLEPASYQPHPAPSAPQRPSSQPVASQRPALIPLDANCAPQHTNLSPQPTKTRMSPSDQHLVDTSQHGRSSNSSCNDVARPPPVADGRRPAVAQAGSPTQPLATHQLLQQISVPSLNGQLHYQQQQQQHQHGRVLHHLHPIFPSAPPQAHYGVSPTQPYSAPPVSHRYSQVQQLPTRPRSSPSAPLHMDSHAASSMSRDSSTLVHALRPHTHIPNAAPFQQPLVPTVSFNPTSNHVQAQLELQQDIKPVVSEAQALPTPPHSSKSMTPEQEHSASGLAHENDSKRYSPPVITATESLKRTCEGMDGNSAHDAVQEPPSKRSRVTDAGEDEVLSIAPEPADDDGPLRAQPQLEIPKEGVGFEMDSDQTLQAETAPIQQATALPTPPTTGIMDSFETDKRGEGEGEGREDNEGSEEGEEEEEGSDDELGLFESVQSNLVNQKRGRLECMLCSDRHARNSASPPFSFDLSTPLDKQLTHFSTVHSYAWGKIRSST